MDCAESEVSTIWNGHISDSHPDDVTNLSLKNFDWRYRGEGNANLVISLPREKIILRMQKTDYSAVLDPTAVMEWELKLKKSVVFYRKVMVPMLGTEFILPPDLARISVDEIADIDRTLVQFRPRFRLSKGIRLGLVTVQPDYTLLPPRESYKSLLGNHNSSYAAKVNEEYGTFCVEIKPKQGWVPFPDRHHPKCTFCLKQYLKLQKKRATTRSKYCPLDLFSGDKSRMRRALEGLLETPQNNLKIFHNGNLFYGEDSSADVGDVLGRFFDLTSPVNVETTLDRWCHLVLDALTREFDCKEGHLSPSIIYPDNNLTYPITDNGTSSSHPSTEQPCNWSNQPLPSKCILQRVLSVQKLQKSDFKTVYSLYKEQETRGNYNYVDELFALHNKLDDVQRYLLSATAKDCSIFIALQKTETSLNDNSSHIIKDLDGVTYRLNIGISDIDPKPLSCIEKHYKRDKELILASKSDDSKNCNNNDITIGGVSAQKSHLNRTWRLVQDNLIHRLRIEDLPRPGTGCPRWSKVVPDMRRSETRCERSGRPYPWSCIIDWIEGTFSDANHGLITKEEEPNTADGKINCLMM